jgi:hypothetical protein
LGRWAPVYEQMKKLGEATIPKHEIYSTPTISLDDIRKRRTQV